MVGRLGPLVYMHHPVSHVRQITFCSLFWDKNFRTVDVHFSIYLDCLLLLSSYLIFFEYYVLQFPDSSL